MNVEYEATYTDINKDEMREKLKKIGAKLIRKEFLQKRTVFNLPGGYDGYKWLRVRDEGDKITLSFKQVGEGGIKSQKELELTVSDYNTATEILKQIGCEEKAYQETRRELWEYHNVDICLDEWPWLEPIIEIEGKNEEDVKKVCKDLGFDYNKAIFDSVDAIFAQKYNISREVINNEISKVTFEEKNPFLK